MDNKIRGNQKNIRPKDTILEDDNQAKQTIDEAFKAFGKTFNTSDDKIGITFQDDDNTVGIPQSLIDLVVALNPVDKEKQKAITYELFKK